MYSIYLKELRCDIIEGLRTFFFQIYVPIWIIYPFFTSSIEVKIEIQENFIDLVADAEHKVKFMKGGYEIFWTQENLRRKCPNICKEI